MLKNPNIRTKSEFLAALRCCHGILWVRSTCSVIMEPVSLKIFLSMSLDDVLITIDKTELD